MPNNKLSVKTGEITKVYQLGSIQRHTMRTKSKIQNIWKMLLEFFLKHSNHLIYADDTTIHIIDKDIDTLYANMNEYLNTIPNCSKQKSSILDTANSNTMLYHTSIKHPHALCILIVVQMHKLQKLISLASNPLVTFNGQSRSTNFAKKLRVSMPLEKQTTCFHKYTEKSFTIHSLNHI